MWEQWILSLMANHERRVEGRKTKTGGKKSFMANPKQIFAASQEDNCQCTPLAYQKVGESLITLGQRLQEAEAVEDNSLLPQPGPQRASLSGDLQYCTLLSKH